MAKSLTKHYYQSLTSSWTNHSITINLNDYSGARSLTDEFAFTNSIIDGINLDNVGGINDHLSFGVSATIFENYSVTNAQNPTDTTRQRALYTLNNTKQLLVNEVDSNYELKAGEYEINEGGKRYVATMQNGTTLMRFYYQNNHTDALAFSVSVNLAFFGLSVSMTDLFDTLNDLLDSSVKFLDDDFVKAIKGVVNPGVAVTKYQNYIDSEGNTKQRALYTYTGINVEGGANKITITRNVYQNNYTEWLEATITFDYRAFKATGRYSSMRAFFNEIVPTIKATDDYLSSGFVNYLKTALPAGFSVTIYDNYNDINGDIKQRALHTFSTSLVDRKVTLSETRMAREGEEVFEDDEGNQYVIRSAKHLFVTSYYYQNNNTNWLAFQISVDVNKYGGNLHTLFDSIESVVRSAGASKENIDSIVAGLNSGILPVGASVTLFDNYVDMNGDLAQRSSAVINRMGKTEVVRVDGEVPEGAAVFTDEEGNTYMVQSTTSIHVTFNFYQNDHTDWLAYSVTVDARYARNGSVQASLNRVLNMIDGLDMLSNQAINKLLNGGLGLGTSVTAYENYVDDTGMVKQRAAYQVMFIEKSFGEDEVTQEEIVRVVPQITFYDYRSGTSLLKISVTVTDVRSASEARGYFNTARRAASNLLEYVVPNEKVSVTLYETITDQIGNVTQRALFTRSAFLDEENRLVQQLTIFIYVNDHSTIVDYTVTMDNSLSLNSGILEQSYFNGLLIDDLKSFDRNEIKEILSYATLMDDSNNPLQYYAESLMRYNVSISFMEYYTDSFGNLQQRVDYTIHSSREESPKPGTSGKSFIDYVMLHVTHYIYLSDQTDFLLCTIDFSDDTVRYYTKTEMNKWIKNILSSGNLMNATLGAGITLTVYEMYTTTNGTVKQRVDFVKSARIVDRNQSAVLETTLTVYEYVNPNSSLIDFTMTFSDLDGALPTGSIDSLISTIKSGGMFNIPGVVSYYDTYKDEQGYTKQRVEKTVANQYETITADDGSTSKQLIRVTTNYIYKSDNDDLIAHTVANYSHKNLTVTTYYQEYTNMWGYERQRIQKTVSVDRDFSTTTTTIYHYQSPYSNLISYTQAHTFNSVTKETSDTTSWYEGYTDAAGRQQQRVRESETYSHSYSPPSGDPEAEDAEDYEPGKWTWNYTHTDYTYFGNSNLIKSTKSTSYSVLKDGNEFIDDPDRTVTVTTTNYAIYYDLSGIKHSRAANSHSVSYGEEDNTITDSVYHYASANDDVVIKITFSGSNSKSTFTGYSNFTIENDSSWKSYTMQNTTYGYFLDPDKMPKDANEDEIWVSGTGETETWFDKYGRVENTYNHTHLEYNYSVTNHYTNAFSYEVEVEVPVLDDNGDPVDADEDGVPDTETSMITIQGYVTTRVDTDVHVIIDTKTTTANTWLEDGSCTQTYAMDDSASDTITDSTYHSTAHYTKIILGNGDVITPGDGYGEIILGPGGSIAHAVVHDSEGNLKYNIVMQAGATVVGNQMTNGTSICEVYLDGVLDFVIEDFTVVVDGELFSHGTFDLVTGDLMITTNYGLALEVINVPGFGIFGYGFKNGTTVGADGAEIGQWVTTPPGGNYNYQGLGDFDSTTTFTLTNGTIQVFIGYNAQSEITGIMIDYLGGTISDIDPDTQQVQWGGFYYNEGAPLVLFSFDIVTGVDGEGNPITVNGLLMENGTAYSKDGAEALWTAETTVSGDGLTRATIITSLKTTTMPAGSVVGGVTLETDTEMANFTMNITREFYSFSYDATSIPQQMLEHDYFDTHDFKSIESSFSFISNKPLTIEEEQLLENYDIDVPAADSPKIFTTSSKITWDEDGKITHASGSWSIDLPGANSGSGFTYSESWTKQYNYHPEDGYLMSITETQSNSVIINSIETEVYTANILTTYDYQEDSEGVRRLMGQTTTTDASSTDPYTGDIESKHTVAVTAHSYDENGNLVKSITTVDGHTIDANGVQTVLETKTSETRYTYLNLGDIDGDEKDDFVMSASYTFGPDFTGNIDATMASIKSSLDNIDWDTVTEEQLSVIIPEHVSVTLFETYYDMNNDPQARAIYTLSNSEHMVMQEISASEAANYDPEDIWTDTDGKMYAQVNQMKVTLTKYLYQNDNTDWTSMSVTIDFSEFTGTQAVSEVFAAVSSAILDNPQIAIDDYGTVAKDVCPVGVSFLIYENYTDINFSNTLDRTSQRVLFGGSNSASMQMKKVEAGYALGTDEILMTDSEGNAWVAYVGSTPTITKYYYYSNKSDALKLSISIDVSMFENSMQDITYIFSFVDIVVNNSNDYMDMINDIVANPRDFAKLLPDGVDISQFEGSGINLLTAVLSNVIVLGVSVTLYSNYWSLDGTKEQRASYTFTGVEHITKEVNNHRVEEGPLGGMTSNQYLGTVNGVNYIFTIGAALSVTKYFYQNVYTDWIDHSISINTEQFNGVDIQAVFDAVHQGLLDPAFDPGTAASFLVNSVNGIDIE